MELSDLQMLLIVSQSRGHPPPPRLTWTRPLMINLHSSNKSFDLSNYKMHWWVETGSCHTAVMAAQVDSMAEGKNGLRAKIGGSRRWKVQPVFRVRAWLIRRAIQIAIDAVQIFWFRYRYGLGRSIWLEMNKVYQLLSMLPSNNRVGDSIKYTECKFSSFV